ncbi:MAG TPA: hypothetical protein VGO47_02660, partial [Chlamydiales bacterium]|nr:hypothetical protein [Chlamydiales bacterium]
QGLADTAVYPNVTREIFKEHCDSQPESRSQLSLYPDMDHDPVLYTSQLEVFDWIEDRFNGKKVLPGCSTRVVVEGVA